MNDKKSTESRNPKSKKLDQMTSLEIIKVMNEEDKKVAYAVEDCLEIIGKLIDEITKSFANGGRLIYVGSGTSGRLGVLDASECPPTFGTDPNKVVALISGGNEAIYEAKEGIEDDKDQAILDLKNINLCQEDILVGIAASGRTPYVISAIEYAKSLGVVTGSIACNENSEISKISDYPIEAVVGPEVLTGSTRLKAATAQKMILNMLTTASMVRSGKAYENLMVDVKASNNKLKKRAKKIVKEITQTSDEIASEYLQKTEGNVKEAICMIKLNCSRETARAKLESTNGFLRKALGES